MRGRYVVPDNQTLWRVKHNQFSTGSSGYAVGSCRSSRMWLSCDPSLKRPEVCLTSDSVALVATWDYPGVSSPVLFFCMWNERRNLQSAALWGETLHARLNLKRTSGSQRESALQKRYTAQQLYQLYPYTAALNPLQKPNMCCVNCWLKMVLCWLPAQRRPWWDRLQLTGSTDESRHVSHLVLSFNEPCLPLLSMHAPSFHKPFGLLQCKHVLSFWN